MPSAHPTTRICKKCGQTKSIFDFPVYDVGKERRRHDCKVCTDARVDAHHQANKERRAARARARYQADPKKHWTPERRARANQLTGLRYTELRLEVYAHYGSKCVCCGEREPLFLTLDHVNNDGKDRRKEHGTGLNQLQWIKRSDFPEEFQLFCYNCNMGKARNGGVCPHKALGTVQRLPRKRVHRQSKPKAVEAPGPSLFGRW